MNCLIFIVLQDIRTRNRYVVDDCFTEMLSHWLSRPSPPPTWSALVKALASPVIGRQDIAGTIKLEPESDTDQGMQESCTCETYSVIIIQYYPLYYYRDVPIVFYSDPIRWLHTEGGEKDHMGGSLRVEESGEPTGS